MDVVGSTFCRFVQRRLADCDLWKAPFSGVRQSLQESLSVLERWSSAAEMLTSQYWRLFSAHPWKADTYVNEQTAQLSARLDEVGCCT